MGTHPIFESDFDCLTEERERISVNIGKSEDALQVKLRGMQEKNSLKFGNNKDYVLDLIDKDNEDLIAAVDKQNSTFNENLDSIRTQTCNKIESTTERTKTNIMYTKDEIIAKIKEIVQTVKYEMAHSKGQINTLKANY